VDAAAGDASPASPRGSTRRSLPASAESIPPAGFLADHEALCVKLGRVRRDEQRRPGRQVAQHGNEHAAPYTGSL
jgi:hypothetical protein